MNRRILLVVVTGAFLSLGAASYQTPNFVVHAPTPQIAQQVGQWAEHYRREKAKLWLGQEMPNWGQPCPLIVQVTMDGPCGATSFNFGQGGVLSQKMEIQGPLDRLIASVLPHEITHTVFAYYFKRPVPRWADEGGSVLSEDDLERDRHDKLVRRILNQNSQYPLRRLFAMDKYPRDVMNLYAQGFSVSDYLVKRSDRQTFLQFIAHGMQSGWDSAAVTYYRHRNIEELESAWLQHLRDTRRQPGTQVAQNVQGTGNNSGTIVRLTVPPIQLPGPPAVVRGQAPTPDQVGQRFGNPRGVPASRPMQVPYFESLVGKGWQPVTPAPNSPTLATSGMPPSHSPSSAPGAVQLGQPQFEPIPMQRFPGQPVSGLLRP